MQNEKIIEILNLLKNKPNMTNFGRHVKTKYMNLFEYIMSLDYPLDASFNERVYCIANNLENRPKIDNKDAKFINYTKGYRGIYIEQIEPTLENIKKYSSEFIKIGENNFSRKFSKIYYKVLEITKNFPESCKFSEKLFCVVNNYSTIPTNMKFINFVKGYIKITNTIKKKTFDTKIVAIAKKLNRENDKEFLEKLNETRERLIKKNKHLYGLPASEEGYSFMYEPIMEVRVKANRGFNIEKLFEITIKEYEEKFGGKVGYCKTSIEQNKNALKRIDPVTGLTVRKVGQNKRKEKMSKVDPITGKTGWETNGENSRKGNLNNIDENGLNGYQRTVLVRGEILDNIRPKDEQTLYYVFYHYCRWLAKDFRKIVDENYNIGKCGLEGAEQIDHKFSIKDGFDSKTSPFAMASEFNLEVLPWRENCTKRENSSITKEDLLFGTNYTEEQSKLEFELFCKVVEKIGGQLNSQRIDLELKKAIKNAKNKEK